MSEIVVDTSEFEDMMGWQQLGSSFEAAVSAGGLGPSDVFGAEFFVDTRVMAGPNMDGGLVDSSHIATESTGDKGTVNDDTKRIDA